MKEQLLNWTQEHFGPLNNLAILCMSVLTGILCSLAFYWFLRLLISKTFHAQYHVINKRYRMAFRLLLGSIFLKIGINLTDFSPETTETLSRIFYICIIIAFTYILIRTTEFIKDVLYARYDVDVQDNLHERKARTQIDFLQKLSSVFITAVAIAIILMSFDRVRELGTSILASAGIAGVILGFAAQKSLANLLAGMQIAFTQPIRLEDVVVVEGEWGRIEEITITYVVVRIWDSRRLIVPISYFIDNPFQSWTRNSSEINGVVFIYTDFSLPVDELRQEVTRILEGDEKKLWDGRVNVVQVTNATEKTMEIRILVSAANSAEAFELRCLVREKLLAYIHKNYPDALPKHRIHDGADGREEGLSGKF
jgi:small-conductance mechanosensitive channel